MPREALYKWKYMATQAKIVLGPSLGPPGLVPFTLASGFSCVLPVLGAILVTTPWELEAAGVQW